MTVSLEGKRVYITGPMPGDENFDEGAFEKAKSLCKLEDAVSVAPHLGWYHELLYLHFR